MKSSTMFLLSSAIIAVSWMCQMTAASKAADFVNPMRHDLFLVTPKSFDGLVNRQRNAFGVTALLHFSSKELEQKRFINEIYNEVAKKVKGMARLGAIDCAEWSVFCKENYNPSLQYPMIVVYPPNPLPPQQLSADLEKKQIVSSILKYIPASNVVSLTPANIDSFVTMNIAIPKVILFSSKVSVPVLFKALSNAFVDRVAFGVVAPNETAIATNYDIKSRPKVIMLRADLKKPEVYKGAVEYGTLHDWVNIRAETFVKGGGFTAPEDLIEVPPKPWINQKVPEISGASHQDICFKSSSLCVIFLSKGTPQPDTIKMLEDLSMIFPAASDRGANFRFGWMDLDLETNFLTTFATTPEQLPSVIVLNAHKKLRFASLPEGKRADEETIRELLERVASGDARFSIIKGQKLPPFAPREAEAPASPRVGKKNEEL